MTHGRPIRVVGQAAQHSCDVVFNHGWDPKHVVKALLHATIGTHPR